MAFARFSFLALLAFALPAAAENRSVMTTEHCPYQLLAFQQGTERAYGIAANPGENVPSAAIPGVRTLFRGEREAPGPARM